MENDQAKPLTGSKIPEWFGVVLAAAIVGVFYFLVPGFGPSESLSPLAWLRSAWNPETSMEQGYLLPIIMVGLFVIKRKALKQAVDPSTRKGLPVLLIAAALFIISHRTGQARVAVAALPMILWGGIWFLWGGKVARLSFFPLFLLILAIPYPYLHQAITHLQILSNELAQIGSGWCGVEIEFQGWKIFSVDGSFDPLEIDQGCGGNPSLMILTVIALVWAYLSNLAFWKKCLLVLLVVPIEIFCNALRLTSIFLIAKYGEMDFARNAWHDWSGLFLFYPAALLILFAIFCLLNGGFPKLGNLWTRKCQDDVPENEKPVVSIKKRSLVLSGLLGIILSLVFVLPRITMTQSAVSLEIPSNLGNWVVQSYPPSRIEVDISCSDTRFAKGACYLKREEERSYITGEAPMDRADLSIVTSGWNLNKSIHRPERWLPVQGYRDLRESRSEITLKNGLIIPVKRILSKLVVDESISIDSISYSVFIGHSDMASSHFQRTLIDLKDRVIKAEEQEWACVTVSMRYEDQAARAFGDPPDFEMADKMARDLFVEVMENNVDWSRFR